MMINLPRNRTSYIALSDVPYVEHPLPQDGREVWLRPFYDTSAQEFWGFGPVSTQRLLAIPVIGIIGTYLASEPAEPASDRHMPLSEWVTQYFTFEGIPQVLSDIERDLLNSLSSLHKYFVFLHHSFQCHGSEDQMMIATEMEYAFGNHRAFYDQLNELVCRIHKIGADKPTELKRSFREVAQKDAEFLANQYGFPDPLVMFYKKRLEGFMTLRAIRDSIYHRGFSLDGILVCPQGFAIAREDDLPRRLGSLGVWNQNQIEESGPVSLLPILTYLADDIYGAMADLSDVLSQSFNPLPPAMYPGYHLYLRSPLARHLQNTHQYREKSWYSQSEVTSILQCYCG